MARQAAPRHRLRLVRFGLPPGPTWVARSERQRVSAALSAFGKKSVQELHRFSEILTIFSKATLIWLVRVSLLILPRYSMVATVSSLAHRSMFYV